MSSVDYGGARWSGVTTAAVMRVMREIADEAGATFMVDMAHFAGLVADGVLDGEFDPVPYADIVTSTTHKTLRGPRGGMILCKNHLAEYVDRGCPLVLGGPLPNVMAAKAVALREALMPEYRVYARRIVENARMLAESLVKQGAKVITGGTHNHIILIDVRPYGLTGRQAESALRSTGITVNRNVIPGDTNGPWYTSGIRIGTPAVTTLGMGTAEMRAIGRILGEVLHATHPGTGKTESQRLSRFDLAREISGQLRSEVEGLLQNYPAYPRVILEDATAESPTGE